MSKLQHRRSISTNRAVYARLKAHCKTHGLSVSGFVQALITEALDREGAPAVDPGPTGYPKRLREVTETQARDIAQRAAANFTF